MQWRKDLEQQGLAFSGSYLGDLGASVRGGTKRNITYDGLLQLNLDADFSPLLHWDGLTTHFSFLAPHGSHDGTRPSGALTDSTNIDFPHGYNLYEAWAQYEHAPTALSLRAGLLVVDGEFAIGGLDSAGLFLNDSLGTDAVLSNGIPAPTLPIAAPGLRIAWTPGDHFYIKGALYDGNPAPGVFPDPSSPASTNANANAFGTHWALRRSEGALWVGELGWQQRPPSSQSTPSAPATAQPLPLDRSFALGFIHHTDTFLDTRGRAPHHGNPALYAAVDCAVWANADATRSVKVFARAMGASSDRNLVDRSAQTGIVCNGPISGRSDDQLGLAWSWLRADTHLLSDDPQPTKARACENVIELSYKARITPWLSLQPDLQYVINPLADRAASNSLVITLRTELLF